MNSQKKKPFNLESFTYYGGQKSKIQIQQKKRLIFKSLEIKNLIEGSKNNVPITKHGISIPI